jgi:S-adenosylmethionine decarboxylase
VTLGTEWLVDARGCDAERLRDRGALEPLLQRIIQELDLHVVGAPAWHQFGGPGGLTALVLLTESHLALHTYPERRAATLNLYCCRPRAAFAWGDALRAALGAADVSVRVVDRGGP